MGGLCHKYIVLPPTQRVSKLTTQNIYTQAFPFINTKQVFINNFKHKKNDTLLFLLKLLDFITWATIKLFQSYLAEIAFNIKHVYTSYHFCITVAEVTRLQCINLMFQKTIKSNSFLEKDLDIYRQNGNHFYFCQSFIKPSQFSYINDINKYTCHSYFEALKDLTLVEKL